MNSCPTPAMPTRLRRVDKRAAAVGLLLAALAAQAHEAADGAIPDEPGWRIGAAAAVVAADADARWPSERWRGVLTTGSAPRRISGGLRAEHAVLDAGVRLNGVLGASVAVGWHDREPAHLEAARVHARWAWGADGLEAGAGRRTVPMGAVIDGAGHFDPAFNQPPLAQRGVLDSPWIDDGVTLAWTREVERGLQKVELGAWRGQAFPAARDGAVVPTLHLQLGWDHAGAHLFAARLRPEGRGAAAVTAGAAGHSHGSLDCRRTLAQRVCFDGRSDVAGASLQWASDDERWAASAAWLARRERGTLYSTSGSADHRATLHGWWLDLSWRPHPAWTLTLRPERLVPRVQVHGIGATALAREAGLDGAQPVERLGLSLGWQLHPAARLSVELGHERQGAAQVSQAALRLLLNLPEALGGRWQGR